MGGSKDDLTKVPGDEAMVGRLAAFIESAAQEKHDWIVGAVDLVQALFAWVTPTGHPAPGDCVCMAAVLPQQTL